jgi:hypothetical protein
MRLRQISTFNVKTRPLLLAPLAHDFAVSLFPILSRAKVRNGTQMKNN